MAQEGIAQERGTPEWYTAASTSTDSALGTKWNFRTAARTTDGFPIATALAGAAVVHHRHPQHQGRHAGHVGLVSPHRQLERRPPRHLPATASPPGADPELAGRAVRQASCRPRRVRPGQLDAEALTVNYGARYEHFAHGIPAETSPAGRFTAARTFGPIDMPTWNSISPRGGLVYDVFGNQKTAVKFSMGRYKQAGSTGFSESYNPLQLTVASVAWTDANLDGVPQGELGCVYQTAGCEINLAQLPKGFGVASLANFDPDIKRMYNIETAVSVQHEVTSGRFRAGRVVSPRLTTTCGGATTRCRRLRTTRRSRCTAPLTARRSRTTTSAPRHVPTSTTSTRTPTRAGRCGSTASSTTSTRV